MRRLRVRILSDKVLMLSLSKHEPIARAIALTQCSMAT